MKPVIKTIAMILMAISINKAFAGSPKLNLIEIFSNGAVQECYDANIFLRGYLENNLQKTIPLYFFTQYPDSTKDPIFKNAPELNRKRAGYYEMPFPPALFINGKRQSDVYNTDSHTNELNKSLGVTSPITIKIEEKRIGNPYDSISVKVIISSDENINNKSVFVYAVEYYHVYFHSSQNEQELFYYNVKEKLSSNEDVKLVLNAGESIELQYKFSKKDHWNSDQIYIVAFIQDDETKEVLQTGTNLEFLTPEISSDNKFITIGKNESKSLSFYVHNTKSYDIDYSIELNPAEQAALPTGFQPVKVNKNNMIVEPGAKSPSLITFTRNEGGCGVAIASLKITPHTNGIGVCKPANYNIYCLTEEAKYAVYGYYTEGWFAHYCYDFGFKTAGMEYFKSVYFNLNKYPELLDCYPPKNFNISYIGIDYYNTGKLGKETNLASKINEAIDSGKSLLITGEIELSWTSKSLASSEAKKFFFDKLKLNLITKSNPRIQHSNGQITNIYQFSLKGLDNLAILEDYNAIVNDYPYQTSGGPFAFYTDPLSPAPDSPSKIICYYDNIITSGAGVAAEIGNSKVVYLSFPPDAMADENNRAKLYTNIINWIAGEGPKEMDSHTSFMGLLTIGKDTVCKVKAKNITNKTIKITNFEIVDDSDNVFELDSIPDLPLELGPNEYVYFNVRFTPKEEKLYSNNSVLITSETSKHRLYLQGGGLNPTSVDNTSPNEKIHIYPNPIKDLAQIRISGMENYNNLNSLQLIDILGNIITELSVDETGKCHLKESISLNNISNGIYFIVSKNASEPIYIKVAVKLN